ncbi:MAG: copper chaperone PCu(A)C [Frankiales bacterium]|nr:copper chaperone PCu(A)C [Frankiales bacterium]
MSSSRTRAGARFARSAALGAATVALLAACGTATADPQAASTSAAAVVSGSASTSALAYRDAWVKTAPSGMTAAFLTLTNTTDADDQLVSVSTAASRMVQLHEMVMKDGAMVMQQKSGGIVVPAHGSAVLEPGGDHIMLMDVAAPIVAGDDVVLTLTFRSGSSLEVHAVAKDYTGAGESYQASPSASAASTDDMDMSGSDSMSSGS